MIPKPMKISAFRYIDRCCEELGLFKPGDGEEFIGIPAGWYDVGALGCIEIHKNGKLSHTINLLSVECIEFVLEEKP